MLFSLVRTLFLSILAATLIVVLGFYQVSRQYDKVRAGTLVDIEERRIRLLREENRVLQAQFEAYRSDPDFRDRAFAELGLHQATEAEVIKVQQQSRTAKQEIR